MTEAKPSLHPRHVFVLARYRALQCVGARYRDAGIKFTSIKTHEQRADADQYIAEHPELLAQCAGAATKILIKAPRKAR